MQAVSQTRVAVVSPILCRRMDNHTSTKETDPGKDALNNTAYNIRVRGDLPGKIVSSNDNPRCAHREQPEGANTGRLTLQIAVDTN